MECLMVMVFKYYKMEECAKEHELTVNYKEKQGRYKRMVTILKGR